MDDSARIPVTAPPFTGITPTSQAPNNQLQLPETGNPTTSASVGEKDGRIDQVVLVERTLRNGATPTLVAGMVMSMAQMQAQIGHPDLVLTITSGNCSLIRTARFHDRIWHGYDLTHSLSHPRAYAIFGEPARPPIDQE